MCGSQLVSLFIVGVKSKMAGAFHCHGHDRVQKHVGSSIADGAEINLHFFLCVLLCDELPVFL